MVHQVFKAEKGDLILHNGVKSKVIGISYCSYTKQYLYDVKELESPYYQIRAVMSNSKSLKNI